MCENEVFGKQLHLSPGNPRFDNQLCPLFGVLHLAEKVCKATFMALDGDTYVQYSSLFKMCSTLTWFPESVKKVKWLSLFDNEFN